MLERPRKRPRSLQGKLPARSVDGGGGADSQTHLMTPLLSEESVSWEDFPKDVQVSSESQRVVSAKEKAPTKQTSTGCGACF